MRVHLSQERAQHSRLVQTRESGYSEVLSEVAGADGSGRAAPGRVRSQSGTYTELKAVFLALQHFFPVVKDRHVLI